MKGKGWRCRFYLTQFTSGHGYFRQYLYWIEKGTTLSCSYYKNDVEYTFFGCSHWTVKRQRLQTRRGDITPDNVVTLMIVSK